MTETEENRILKLLSSHDNEAYKLLYDYYYLPLVLFAEEFVHERDTAEDLVQETFISLLNVNSRFDNLVHLKSYLYNSLRNKCLNHLRHQKIHHEFVEKELHESESFFELKVIEEDVYSLLISAINQLSPQSREVMDLSLQGLSNTEIAEKLHLSVETVKSYKKSSKKKIAEYLAREDLTAFLFFISLWYPSFH